MAATPTGPPALAPEAQPTRGYAAALRLVLLWAPITLYASMQIPGFFTNSGSSNGVKTVVFFGTLAVCVGLQAGATLLEARRIHATSPLVNLDLLRLVAILIAIADLSVIATAFTGFEIAYEIQ